MFKLTLNQPTVLNAIISGDQERTQKQPNTQEPLPPSSRKRKMKEKQTPIDFLAGQAIDESQEQIKRGEMTKVVEQAIDELWEQIKRGEVTKVVDRVHYNVGTMLAKVRKFCGKSKILWGQVEETEVTEWTEFAVGYGIRRGRFVLDKNTSKLSLANKGTPHTIGEALPREREAATATPLSEEDAEGDSFVETLGSGDKGGKIDLPSTDVLVWVQPEEEQLAYGEQHTLHSEQRDTGAHRQSEYAVERRVVPASEPFLCVGEAATATSLSERDTEENSFVEWLMKQKEKNRMIKLLDPDESMKGRLSQVAEHIAKTFQQKNLIYFTQFKQDLIDKCLDLLFEKTEGVLTPELVLRLWALLISTKAFSDLSTFMWMLRTRERAKKWSQLKIEWDILYASDETDFMNEISEISLKFSQKLLKEDIRRRKVMTVIMGGVNIYLSHRILVIMKVQELENIRHSQHPEKPLCRVGYQKIQVVKKETRTPHTIGEALPREREAATATSAFRRRYRKK